MKTVQDAYIVAATRTPVGKAQGVFKQQRPDDLLAHVLAQLMQQTPAIDPSVISDVIIGCAMPEAEQGMNVARIASLLAGLPNVVPAYTLNRFCASGLQAIATAADRIATGQADLVIAGGVESMSMIPMGGHHFVANPRLFGADQAHLAIAYGMGTTAEIVAQRWHISREAQDQFALTSHQRALAAIAAGEFQQEIAPYPLQETHPDWVHGQYQTTQRLIRDDQGPRADTALASLAKLRTVFAATGTVTAGNSSQMSDGAAAVLLASEAAVQRYQLTPLARFVNYAVVGVAPEVMGIGPVEAIPQVLQRSGVSLQQVDWIELNEAFAAQSLAVMQSLALDPSKVNPLGGAIALGHPLGATGAIRMATLVHGLRRKQQKYGLVTMCIGTGMGAAGLIERL